MILKDITFEFCDFCEVSQKNAQEKVANQQCVICSKWVCSNGCKGVEKDDYYTTSHFPKTYSSQFDVGFVCKECWDKARTIDSSSITRGIDIHASGSSWAIRLAEYAHMVYKKALKKAEGQTLNEIRRLVKEGEKKFGKEREKQELKRKVEELERQISEKV